MRTKMLLFMLFLGGCGPASCWMSERQMDACIRMCIPNGVRSYNAEGCHCNVPERDGGQ